MSFYRPQGEICFSIKHLFHLLQPLNGCYGVSLLKDVASAHKTVGTGFNERRSCNIGHAAVDLNDGFASALVNKFAQTL